MPDSGRQAEQRGKTHASVNTTYDSIIPSNGALQGQRPPPSSPANEMYRHRRVVARVMPVHPKKAHLTHTHTHICMQTHTSAAFLK